MPTKKDFPVADDEAAALRRELAEARQAKQETEAALTRLQQQADEQKTVLLSQIERWKQVCAEYHDDAEKLRGWRRVRQRIAPDGSLRHLLLGALKSGGERTRRRRHRRADLEHANPVLRCEYPDLAAREQISGFSCVRGWAWPRPAIERIDILIDGAHAGNAFYGFVRPDVTRSHPERGDDVHLGFAFRLDAKTLSTGSHVLRITAVGANGQTTSVEGNIEVVSEQRADELRCQEAEHNSPSSARAQEMGSHSAISRGEETVEASVIIFACNQAEFLSRSLPVITSQGASFKFEVIGFDTESDDGTVQVFRRYGARVVSVRRDEFHHVNTRLRSLKEARGKFMIFVVGDAIPANDHWLEGLVRPLMDDPLVAASYSRQLPAPGCVPWESRDIYGGCSVVREVRQIDWSQQAEVENYRQHQWKFISFSDVSACYRRAVLETLPIPEALPEVEDQFWCKCLLEAGYRVVLEPTSLVIHSHNHSIRELYRRQLRFGRCFATFMDVQPEPIRNFVYGIVNDTTNDLLFIAGSKANWLLKGKWILQTPVMRFVKRFGLRQGFRLGGFRVEQRDGDDLVGARTSTDTVMIERSK